MNTQRKSTQKGFTLIELMITVAIVGILAAVAVPAYQDYVAKSQAAEAISLADGLKTPVLDYVMSKGSCPDNTSAATGGIQASTSITGTYVASVTTAGTAPACTITALFINSATSINTGLKGNSIVMTASAGASSGTYTWKCSSSNVAQRYLPHACSGT